MNAIDGFWKVRAFLIFITIVPSFIGYPVNLVSSTYIFSWATSNLDIVPKDGLILYLIFSLITIRAICGSEIFITSITTASITSISLVFIGSLVAYVKISLMGSGISSLGGDSLYYMHRLITMMTVVPLSLSFFLIIPFDSIEHNIITSDSGVSMYKKCLLLISRVVNNIRFGVMPYIFMINSEEQYKSHGPTVRQKHRLNLDYIKDKAYQTIKRYLYLAASAIAFSLEYIPIWAYEISRIPKK
jgi:hypothetical protein